MICRTSSAAVRIRLDGIARYVRILPPFQKSPSPRNITIFPPAMHTNLDPKDRADLARFLREAIEADRYPLSPRVRRLKELLAKVDPGPPPAVTPVVYSN